MKKFDNRMLRLASRTGAFALAVAAGLAAGQAWAQSASLANAPLFTSSSTQVKPNIMFILDDSGSMARDYLPDAAGTFASGTYGKASSHCNGVAYNSGVKYLVPVDYKGNPIAAAPDIYKEDPTTTTSQRTVNGTVTIGAVGTTVSVKQIQGNKPGQSWYDVGDMVTVYTTATKFLVGSVVSWSTGSRELVVKITMVAGSGSMTNPIVGVGEPSTTEYTYYKYKGAQLQDLDFAYDSSGNVIKTNDFYKECNYVVDSTSGRLVFDTIKVNGASTEAQNYANWYTYYRTRMTMMKSSISHAFKGLDDTYRIGYSTISEESVAEGDDFQHVRDFKTGAGEQKENFYKKFNAASPVSYTPLRGALSKAGKYFAKKVSGQTYDPMQYSCQRNFTILSTDGFWNTNDENTTYGPYGLDGVAVGDVDGSLERPMLDANKARNTLADVAAYYYQTDLRTSALNNCAGSITGVDVCANNVVGTANKDPYKSFGDGAAWQHMTTFTLGLGVAGTLDFDKNYQTVRAGDFHKIVNREKDWPIPVSDKPTAVDDLWHAAVNGRGMYFSAGNPASLSAGLNSALASIGGTVGSAAAASTSSLQPVAGDDDIYVAQFKTMEWWGDVLAYKIDTDNGTINPGKTWSAKEKLEEKDWTTRKIYYPQPGAVTPTLRAFTYENLKADGLNGHFENFCTKTAASNAGVPVQCSTIVPDDVTRANDGTNLVNFLAGDKLQSAYYRDRTARLGDIINASPLFIGKPQFKYQDAGYSDFVTAKTSRAKVVLAAANDGMLHAFARDTGEELWAFIPSFVIPNLYKLADAGFQDHHSYFVDGSPQVGDIFTGGEWRTIVVGGLNKGGRGYYALDLTDPTTPKLLWEFRHKDLGYSYGNPIITKRTNGDWVVVFGSGYDNNVDAGLGAGDGNGHLFVLNAATGAKLEQISTFTDSAGTTPAGTVASQNGLSRINNWVVTDADNTSLRFYGGDLKGNVWRFDIDNQVAPNKKALRLAQLVRGGVAQPVTVKPALAEVNYNGNKYPVVYVPTGAYIRTTDPADKSIQSIYAIKDPLTNTPYGDVRADTRFVTQTINDAINPETKKPTRTQTYTTVDWATKAGWRADFPVGGERVSVNPQLALETLYVGSNLPSSDACSVGGESFLYEFNINDGSFTPTYVGGVLVQGLTVVQLTVGKNAGAIVTIITRSDGSIQTDVNSPVNPAASLRRTSWRELVD